MSIVVNEVLYGTLHGSDYTITILCCSNRIGLPLMSVPQVPYTSVPLLCKHDWGKEMTAMPLPHERIWGSSGVVPLPLPTAPPILSMRKLKSREVK